LIVDVQVESDDASGVPLLRGWLADDAPCRRSLVGIASPGGPDDEMGVGSEIVRLVFEPGGVLVNAAAAVGAAASAWLASRPRRRVRLRVRAGDREVLVEAPNGDEAEQIARAILRVLDER
jgi:hypothetical protein